MKIPLLFALVGTVCGASWAQNQAVLSNPYVAGMSVAEASTGTTRTGADTAQADKKQTFKFTLKNMKPSVMAYLLDPANHPVPPELAGANIRFQPDLFGLKTSALVPGNGNMGGSPEARSTTAPIASQNTGVKRQVEIEAQFISISTSDVREFFPQGLRPRSVQNVGSRFATALMTSEQNKKIVYFSAPRSLTFDNVRTTLKQITSQFVKITNVDGTPNINGLISPPLSLETRRVVQVTPTINDKGTVTLDAIIEKSTGVPDPSGKGDGITLNALEPLRFVAAVRNGERLVAVLEQTVGLIQPGHTEMVILRPLIVEDTSKK